MINNRWTERRTQRNQAGKTIEYPGYIRNIVLQFNQNKNKRKIKTRNGLKDTKFLAQYRCKVCRRKATNVCSSCGDYVCYDKSDRFGIDTHYEGNY